MASMTTMISAAAYGFSLAPSGLHPGQWPATFRAPYLDMAPYKFARAATLSARHVNVQLAVEPVPGSCPSCGDRLSNNKRDIESNAITPFSNANTPSYLSASRTGTAAHSSCAPPARTSGLLTPTSLRRPSTPTPTPQRYGAYQIM